MIYRAYSKGNLACHAVAEGQFLRGKACATLQQQESSFVPINIAYARFLNCDVIAALGLA